MRVDTLNHRNRNIRPPSSAIGTCQFSLIVYFLFICCPLLLNQTTGVFSAAAQNVAIRDASPINKVKPSLKTGYRWIEQLQETGELQPGFVFLHPWLDKVLILDNGDIAAMEKFICPFQATITLTRFKTASVISSGWQLRKIRGDNPDERTRRMRVALAERLVDRCIPYHPCSCSVSYWWGYILHARRPRLWFLSACPMATSLEKVTPEEVSSGKFVFTSGRGGKFKDFPKIDLNHDVNFGCFGRALRWKTEPMCCLLS